MICYLDKLFFLQTLVVELFLIITFQAGRGHYIHHTPVVREANYRTETFENTYSLHFIFSLLRYCNHHYKRGILCTSIFFLITNKKSFYDRRVHRVCKMWIKSLKRLASIWAQHKSAKSLLSLLSLCTGIHCKGICNLYTLLFLPWQFYQFIYGWWHRCCIVGN